VEESRLLGVKHVTDNFSRVHLSQVAAAAAATTAGATDALGLFNGALNHDG